MANTSSNAIIQFGQSTLLLNHTALRMAKTPKGFSCFECNRVKPSLGFTSIKHKDSNQPAQPCYLTDIFTSARRFFTIYKLCKNSKSSDQTDRSINSGQSLCISNINYSQLSLSRSQWDPLKHFEISVLRHIRFAELRKIPIEQPNFTNERAL